jgi:hypothetical protein
MLQAGRMPVRVPDEVDFFNLPNPSSRAMALGSTQPQTEMGTRNLPGCNKPPACSADNLAASVSGMSENVGASTSRNPKGLQGLYRENFTYLWEMVLDISFNASLNNKKNWKRIWENAG